MFPWQVSVSFSKRKKHWFGKRWRERKTTHDEVTERAARTDADPTAEPVDASSPPGHASVLDHPYLPHWRVILLMSFPHLLPIAGAECRTEVALVFDTACQDSCPRSGVSACTGNRAGLAERGVLGPLGDDHLVLDCVVDHLELIAVWLSAGSGVRRVGGEYGAVVEVVWGLREGRGGGLGARLGLGRGRGGVGCRVPIGGKEEHYARLSVGGVDAVAVDTYASEVDVFGVYGGPTFHKEFGDLGGG